MKKTKTESDVRLSKSSKLAGWWKEITIEPVVFLYMLAIYMNIPTEEALLYRQVCYKYSNSSFCSTMSRRLTLPNDVERKIQRSTSIYLMYFNFLYSIPSILISMICTVFSEKYSHKIAMIFSNVGCILSSTINLLISTMRTDLSIRYFIFSNFFISFFGSSSTMFSIVYNYIVRITNDQNRTLRIAMLESSLLFGSTFGLILSGILLDFIDFDLIFSLIIFLHLINICYIVFFVDEIIERGEKRFSWKDFCRNFNIFRDLRDSFRILVKPREKNRRKFLLLALGGLLLSM